MNAFFLKNIRQYFNFPGLSLPGTHNSGLYLDEKMAAMKRTFSVEVADYLERYPQTKHIDVYLNDINGIMRGKRLSVDNMLSLENGCYFPLSVYSMDQKGKIAAPLHDEPDRLCVPVAGSLRPSLHDPQHSAQILLTMKDTNGQDCPFEPRVILQNVLERFHQHGLFPVIAPEVEFYLTGKGAQDTQNQGCFHMDTSAAHAALFDELEQLAHCQHIPLTGIVAEAESGQFELNLRHSHRVVETCDNVLALRRLTRFVADKNGLQASFMAKPFSLQSGSGLHFHFSLNNIHGENVFASPAEELNGMMRLCIAGQLALMPASIAILAPGVNGFRRLRKNLTEPLFNSWGYNTRSAALRIPCSDEGNRRIEYRLAGADANPYLVVATILTGMLYGLENVDEQDLQEPQHDEPVLPLFQQQAIEAFSGNQYLIDSLGEAFSQQWIACKLSELEGFERIVTEQELTLA
ncbi:glutamine synthetase family protein [Enterobacter cloacae]|uniref:glutamine synthetase family protein n=1 Tax=Enterobacter cloacae TaxID=550 RepID=UPI0028EE9287|nr:glutamine synthetase family protein [Enterobacter cloacae]WNT35121.1 glutamine synthetase family protein [Enterobacter cloacae]HDR2792306.1 glutamine synthetase [Enterobacter asburiae]HDR2797670.1 glutamine synthetase [Enterobacter asburiae]